MKVNLHLLGLVATAVILIFTLGACASQNGTAGTEASAPPFPGQASSVGLTDPVICTRQRALVEAPLGPNAHVTGTLEDFAATILVYNDFACEGCATTTTALNLALELYPEDLRLEFRTFPNPTNPQSMLAAQFAEAAGKQGKFWEAHDLLYGAQADWLALDQEGLLDWVWQQAESLALDPEQFAEDINSEEVFAILTENINLGLAYANSAPFVLVNDTPLPLYISSNSDFLLYLETLMIPYGRHIRNLKYSDCPPETIDPAANYTATLVTDQGNITFALYPDIAPFAVNNFIFLAEEDYYDHTPFFAVLEGVLARAGDPSGTGWGTPGYMFSTEISDQLTLDRPGMVAMSIAAPDLVNSQFFITYSALPTMNGQFTIFGEVVEGMDVLNELTPRDPEINPLQPFNNEILDVIITKQ